MYRQSQCLAGLNVLPVSQCLANLISPISMYCWSLDVLLVSQCLANLIVSPISILNVLPVSQCFASLVSLNVCQSQCFTNFNVFQVSRSSSQCLAGLSMSCRSLNVLPVSQCLAGLSMSCHSLSISTISVSCHFLSVLLLSVSYYSQCLTNILALDDKTNRKLIQIIGMMYIYNSNGYMIKIITVTIEMEDSIITVKDSSSLISSLVQIAGNNTQYHEK
ncbi:hypothetical protein ACTA71_005350 [Dictyostelium dimigraforme]